MTDNNSFLIGGINSKEVITNVKSIPFIENIPILGDITTYKSTKINDYSFSIFITMLPTTNEVMVFPCYLENTPLKICPNGYFKSTHEPQKGSPLAGNGGRALGYI